MFKGGKGRWSFVLVVRLRYPDMTHQHKYKVERSLVSGH